VAAEAKFCAVCGEPVSGDLVEALPAAARDRWEQ
jgi:hypothetical protein